MKESVYINKGVLENKTVECDIPNYCPQCKCILKPEILVSAVFKNHENIYFLSLNCLCRFCFQPYILFYEIRITKNDYGTYLADNSKFIYMEPVRYTKKEFSFQINETSSNFVKIYNQALAAETYKLEDISGVGYRKALEFLIKDFLIKENPIEEEKIKNLSISQCIEKYINDPNLKIASSRAAWLGNDQTHYIQKHTEKDLEDLKRLIDVTCHWINMILLTKEASVIGPI